MKLGFHKIVCLLILNKCIQISCGKHACTLNNQFKFKYKGQKILFIYFPCVSHKMYSAVLLVFYFLPWPWVTSGQVKGNVNSGNNYIYNIIYIYIYIYYMYFNSKEIVI